MIQVHFHKLIRIPEYIIKFYSMKFPMTRNVEDIHVFVVWRFKLYGGPC